MILSWNLKVEDSLPDEELSKQKSQMQKSWCKKEEGGKIKFKILVICSKNKTTSTFIMYCIQKIKFKWVVDINVRAGTIKIL